MIISSRVTSLHLNVTRHFIKKKKRCTGQLVVKIALALQTSGLTYHFDKQKNSHDYAKCSIIVNHCKENVQKGIILVVTSMLQ